MPSAFPPDTRCTRWHSRSSPSPIFLHLPLYRSEAGRAGSEWSSDVCSSDLKSETATTVNAFSFPSGHTLHAMAFTVVAVSDFPALASLLVPFTLLVALSRVVLGLHYPSDVLAGAAIGAGVAQAVLAL